MRTPDFITLVHNEIDKQLLSQSDQLSIGVNNEIFFSVYTVAKKQCTNDVCFIVELPMITRTTINKYKKWIDIDLDYYAKHHKVRDCIILPDHC